MSAIEPVRTDDEPGAAPAGPTPGGRRPVTPMGGPYKPLGEPAVVVNGGPYKPLDEPVALLGSDQPPAERLDVVGGDVDRLSGKSDAVVNGGPHKPLDEPVNEVNGGPYKPLDEPVTAVAN
ncbi:hypothetical protein [Actinosynnema sp.]|uniref:hypothetical protein n=1 Tax=Actinosynnema sp. TaxID=1872144 RepID=UPI003F861B04